MHALVDQVCKAGTVPICCLFKRPKDIRLNHYMTWGGITASRTQKLMPSLGILCPRTMRFFSTSTWLPKIKHHELILPRNLT